MILDPAAPPTFSVISTNYEKLRVCLYQVDPEAHFAASRWGHHFQYVLA